MSDKHLEMSRNGYQSTSVPSDCRAESALAEHFIDTGHIFSFKLKILAKTRGKYPRLVREAIEIYKHLDNINRDDGLRLKAAWLPMLYAATRKSALAEVCPILGHF